MERRGKIQGSQELSHQNTGHSQGNQERSHQAWSGTLGSHSTFCGESIVSALFMGLVVLIPEVSSMTGTWVVILSRQPQEAVSVLLMICRSRGDDLGHLRLAE